MVTSNQYVIFIGSNKSNRSNREYYLVNNSSLIDINLLESHAFMINIST